MMLDNDSSMLKIKFKNYVHWNVKMQQMLSKLNQTNPENYFWKIILSDYNTEITCI